MSANPHEFALIEWIRAQAAHHPRLAIGIGDDTASVRFPDPSECLVTSDMLMEGIHFTIPSATPRDIGRKALAVNLSDIAAMAGNPLAAVIGVALSRKQDMNSADLAEILATIEVESEIPLEALAAIAEILSYVYRTQSKVAPAQESGA